MADKKSNIVKNILAFLMIMVGITVSVQFRVVSPEKRSWKRAGSWRIMKRRSKN